MLVLVTANIHFGRAFVKGYENGQREIFNKRNQTSASSFKRQSVTNCVKKTALGLDIGKWVVECKASAAPQLTKGNWSAIEDIKPDKSFIIAPVSSTYPIAENVWVTHLLDFLKEIG